MHNIDRTTLPALENTLRRRFLTEHRFFSKILCIYITDRSWHRGDFPSTVIAGPSRLWGYIDLQQVFLLNCKSFPLARVAMNVCSIKAAWLERDWLELLPPCEWLGNYGTWCMQCKNSLASTIYFSHFGRDRLFLSVANISFIYDANQSSMITACRAQAGVDS